MQPHLSSRRKLQMGFQKQHSNPFSNDQQLLSLLGHPADSSAGARARSGIPLSLHYHTQIDEASILGYWSLKLDSLIPLCVLQPSARWSSQLDGGSSSRKSNAGAVLGRSQRQSAPSGSADSSEDAHANRRRHAHAHTHTLLLSSL